MPFLQAFLDYSTQEMLHQCFASLAAAAGSPISADLRLTLQDCRLGFNLAAADGLEKQLGAAARAHAIAAGDEAADDGPEADTAATGAAAGPSSRPGTATSGSSRPGSPTAGRPDAAGAAIGQQPETASPFQAAASEAGAGSSGGAGAKGRPELLVPLQQVALFLREAGLVPRVLAKLVTDQYHVRAAA